MPYLLVVNTMFVEHNFKVKKVINASGRMSVLGVSNISDTVLEAMKYGAQHYFIMDELHEEAGRMAAAYFHTEDALITNSASAGITLAIAGLLTKGDKRKCQQLLSNSIDFPREVLLMKGHHIDYGVPISTMIQLGGGQIKEIGFANRCTLEEIENNITEATTCMIYVQSHHCVQKNIPSIEEVREIVQKYNVPLIVDAAAEENLVAYAKLADLVIYSGSKAIEGPTSGIIAGKSEFISYAKQHINGIGRAMKIGKETIFGLLQALKEYNTFSMTKNEQMNRLNSLTRLANIKGIKVQIHQDEAGRNIFRARIFVDSNQAHISATELVKQLQQGEVAIYTRDYNTNRGFFDIDPRPLLDGDTKVIIQKITEIMEGEKI